MVWSSAKSAHRAVRTTAAMVVAMDALQHVMVAVPAVLAQQEQHRTRHVHHVQQQTN